MAEGERTSMRDASSWGPADAEGIPPAWAHCMRRRAISVCASALPEEPVAVEVEAAAVLEPAAAADEVESVARSVVGLAASVAAGCSGRGAEPILCCQLFLFIYWSPVRPTT